MSKKITTTFAEAPQGLYIVLTRIVYDVIQTRQRRIARMRKIDTPVPISNEIRVPLNGGQEARYSLVNFTEHRGSPESGHIVGHVMGKN